MSATHVPQHPLAQLPTSGDGHRHFQQTIGSTVGNFAWCFTPSACYVNTLEGGTFKDFMYLLEMMVGFLNLTGQ